MVTPSPNIYEHVQTTPLREVVRKVVCEGEDRAEMDRLVLTMRPGLDGLPEDFPLAAVMFSLAAEATELGLREAALAFRDRSIEWCSAQSIQAAAISGMLVHARRQGWLPAERYDELAGLVAEVAPETSPAYAMLAEIERREE